MTGRGAPLLRVTDLHTYFRMPEGVSRAVDGVSFEIEEGQTYALVGESGCGKSVTALSIIQLVQQPAGYIASGRIEYRGRDIVRLPEMLEGQVAVLSRSGSSLVARARMATFLPVLPRVYSRTPRRYARMKR